MTVAAVRPVDHQLPYGVGDLVQNVVPLIDKPRTVRCYVQGCDEQLRTPTRRDRGEVCPSHGIRCHFSTAGVTYSYADVRGNIIASADLFARRIVGHPFKYESHRLGLERSEDAVSWNVFRSLQEAGCLRHLARHITGIDQPHEPFLYLWGICTTDDTLDPWPLLIAARERFESHLPVDRPLTEPDIALYLPGQYLILIEAKFTSPNTYYEQGPRKDTQSLTLDELLAIYHDRALRILDCGHAVQRGRIAYQLWRNMIFAEWMARLDHPATKAYHVNLVRSGYERDTAAEFGELLTDDHQDRFRRLTWEAIYKSVTSEARLQRLRAYLRTKTAGLVKAFRVN